MKTLKELKSMGVVANLAKQVFDFQETNQLSKLEMLILLQNLQCYLMDTLHEDFVSRDEF